MSAHRHWAATPHGTSPRGSWCGSTGIELPATLPLEDTAADPFEFDSDTQIRFRKADGLTLTTGNFAAIDVNGSVLTGRKRETDQPVTVDLTQVTAVEARKFSVVKTVCAAVGIPLGVATITAAAFMVWAGSHTWSYPANGQAAAPR